MLWQFLKCSCQNVAWLVQFRENTENIFLIFENCIWKKHHKSTEFYFRSVFYFITSVLQLTELWTATDFSAEKKPNHEILFEIVTIIYAIRFISIFILFGLILWHITTLAGSLVEYKWEFKLHELDPMNKPCHRHLFHDCKQKLIENIHKNTIKRNSNFEQYILFILCVVTKRVCWLFYSLQ